MPDPRRILSIHATKLAIDPVGAAFGALWPEAEALSLLDESLSRDRANTGELSPALKDRVFSLGHYAEAAGADGILYTCSAFGEAIERFAQISTRPVLKPNEAMFDDALDRGGRVAMIYTFPASVVGMEAEFAEQAARRGGGAEIRSVLADGARPALEAGDAKTHNQIIADTAAGITNADVIMLAHFSMARASALARAAATVPVLTSPEAAVMKMRDLLKTSAL